MTLRTTIAATTTVLALGGLTAVAMSAGGAEPSTAGAEPQAVQVRTQVVSRVQRRPRHVSRPAADAARAGERAGGDRSGSRMSDRSRADDRGADDHARDDDDHGADEPDDEGHHDD